MSKQKPTSGLTVGTVRRALRAYPDALKTFDNYPDDMLIGDNDIQFMPKSIYSAWWTTEYVRNVASDLKGAPISDVELDDILAECDVPSAIENAINEGTSIYDETTFVIAEWMNTQNAEEEGE